MSQDIRWQQRLANYAKALDSLTAAAELAAHRPLSDLEKQGLIHAFEFTHELAWNVMRDYSPIKAIRPSPAPATPPGKPSAKGSSPMARAGWT